MKAIVTKDMLPVDFDKGAPFEKHAANADAWRGQPRHGAPEVSTLRISLTSAAVCIAILAWAMANAYLSQL